MILPFLAGSPAIAAILVSTLGGGFENSIAISENQWAAVKFTTDGASHQLSSVSINYGNYADQGDDAFVSVYTDDAGAPGIPVNSLALVPRTPVGSTSTTYFDAAEVIELGITTDYWVVAGFLDSNPAATSAYTWSRGGGTNPSGGNGVVTAGTFASTNSGASWAFNDANTPFFSVIVDEGSLIPEPSEAIGLAGLLCRGLVLFRRRD